MITKQRKYCVRYDGKDPNILFTEIWVPKNIAGNKEKTRKYLMEAKKKCDEGKTDG